MLKRRMVLSAFPMDLPGVEVRCRVRGTERVYMDSALGDVNDWKF